MAQDTVVVFDPDGKFVRSFGKQYHGGGHGIDIREEDGQEFLYLAFMFPVNLVVKTDLKGEVVWIKEKPEEPGVYDDPADARFSPTNVAFSPDGGFYVGDGYGSNYVHQYDQGREWVRTFGGTGTEPGKMRTPHGLWFDDRPGREADLVVADRANARLQYFTPEGHVPLDHRRGQLPRPLRHPRATSCSSPTSTPASASSTARTRSSPTSAMNRRGPTRSSTASRSAPSPTAGDPAASSTRTTPASTATATSSSPSGSSPAA